MSNKKYAVIVAGGSGTRMSQSQPKQFLEIGGKPILLHALKAFNDFDSDISIIVVLPKEHLKTWKELCEKYKFDTKHKVVEGGSSRFESSKKGLNAISGSGIVAIHDGARPLVSVQVISETFNQAGRQGNGVAAVPLKDSIRETMGDQNRNVERDKYFAIQTPQAFQLDLIQKAFDHADNSKKYTDDASVLEDLGEKIYLTAGSYENIKVTTPEDLVVAEAILKSRQ